MVYASQLPAQFSDFSYLVPFLFTYFCTALCQFFLQNSSSYVFLPLNQGNRANKYAGGCYVLELLLYKGSHMLNYLLQCYLLCETLFKMLEKLCFGTESVTFLKDSTCMQFGIESLKISKAPTKFLNVNLFRLVILDGIAFFFK